MEESPPDFLIQVRQEAPGARLERAGDEVIDGSAGKLDAAAALAHQAAEKLNDVFSGAGPDSAASSSASPSRRRRGFRSSRRARSAPRSPSP